MYNIAVLPTVIVFSFLQDSLDSHHGIEVVHRDFRFIKHLPSVWIFASGSTATGKTRPLYLAFCK